MLRKIIVFFTLIIVSNIILTTFDAEAMPGFARKYKMSCTVCHNPFPRLKEYGDEYAGNGFRLPEGEPKRATIDTGDDKLTLMRDFPIGMRVDLFGTYEPDEETAESDFKTPYNVKILSGGPVSEKLSYYLYFFFSEHGEIAGLEDAFIYARDLFGSGINLTIGQFAVSDPLFKGELRLMYEKYAVFDKKPPQSLTNLKYDRGIVLDYGFDFGFDVVLQVVNGNGIGEAEGDAKTFDNDTNKNVMVRLSQSMGAFRVGGFSYIGKECLEMDETDLSFHGENEIDYFGGDFTLAFRHFELNGLYFLRKDSNPYFQREQEEIESTGIMLEALYFPQGDPTNWAIAALYNNFDSDYEGDIIDYESATVNISYLASRNARIIAEYTHIMKDYSRGPEFENENRFLFGMVTAF